MYELGLDSEAAADHLRNVLRSIDRIEELSPRISRPPGAGSLLSELDGLTAEAPVMVSKSVHTGLVTAKDCLVQIAMLVREGYYMVAALQTLMRTALMGSARAAFVLAPDDPAARERAARIVVEQEAKSLLRALTAIQDFQHLQGIVPPQDFRDEMASRAAELEKMGRHGEGQTISEMSKVMAERLVSGGYDDDHSSEVLAEAVTWIWHSASGGAHAYGWPRMAGGDFVSDLGVVVSVASMAVEAAIERWD